MNIPSRITGITVTRLFNIGQYEHYKIELSALVGENDNASEVFKSLENAVNDLNPKAPYDEYELKRCVELLSKPASEIEIGYYGQSVDDQIKNARKVVNECSEWENKRNQSIARLGNLIK